MEEWELSKENVLPLKQGRKASNLSAALQPSNTDKNKSFLAERQAFETEIRTNNGDDPLDPWYRYFKWTLQNFPQGGKGSNLSTLLDRFFQFFQSQTKYHNDHRLVEIWLQTASMSNQSMECYQFMRDQGIGTKCSQFYESWAWQMEQLGNTQKADLIYQEGLRNDAQPIERLNKMHREFQSRVSRAAFEQLAQSEESTSSAARQEQRTTLGDLRGRGKHHKVGTQRIGSAKARPLQGLRGQPVEPLQTSNKPLQIFCDDENDGAASLPGSNRQWGSLPTNEDLRKENMSKPSQWNKHSVPQRGGTAVPLRPSKPAFSIHEDQEAQQSTPQRPLEINSQVLSDRKQEDTFRTLPFVPEEPKPNTKVMYCKHLVYGGATEMSFEELRAIKYRAKKEKQMIQIEKEKLAAERALFTQQLENMRREQQEFMEKQKRENELILQQQREMLMQAQREMNRKAPPDSEERRTSNESEGSVCTQRLTFDDVTNTETNGIPRVPIGNESSSKEGVKPTSLNAVGGETTTPNVSLNASGVSQPKTPLENSWADPSRFLNKTGSGRTPKGIAQPSPTINTKEALDVIMGALNSSLGDMQLGTGRLGKVDEEPMAENAATMNSFSHHEESSAFCPVQQSQPHQPPARGPFGGLGQGWDGQIYMDPKEERSPECTNDEECKENMPPSGYQQFKEERGQLRVLQPSEGIACDPESAPGLDQNDEANDEEEPMEQEQLPPPGAIPKANSSYARCHDSTIFQSTSGNISFNTASHMASTPFHSSTSLHFPPMSVIRRDNLTQGEESFVKSKVEADQVAVETKSLAGRPQRTTVDSAAQEESLEVTQYPQVEDEAKVLSPIIETSAEDARSSTSSSSSASDFLSQQRLPRSSTLPSITESSFRQERREDVSNITLRRGNSSRQPSVEDEMDGLVEEAQNLSQTKPKSLADELMEVKAGVQNVSLMEDEEVQESQRGDVSMQEAPEAADDPNPFSEELKDLLLHRLEKTVDSYDGFVDFGGDTLLIEVGSAIDIDADKQMCYIFKCCGEGAFAKIYLGQPLSLSLGGESVPDKALKVQKPPCPWEFYISRIIHERVSTSNIDTHVLESVMFAESFLLCKTESCLVMDHHPHGTLLGLVNLFSAKGKKLQEWMVALLTINILEVVEALHRSKIIHADIKPDNFMLQNLTRESEGPCLKLIDFGQSIDMSLFPERTTFSAVCNTSSFTCTEMKEGRPWTYQPDYFGIAGTIHCMLFGTYMKVYRERGICKTTGLFKRTYSCGWKGIFHTLLNVASCEPSDLVDLKKIREQIESERDKKFTLKTMRMELNMELPN